MSKLPFELLLALRKERPKASVESLVRAARLAGKVPADARLRRTTVYRLLARHGATAAVPSSTRGAATSRSTTRLSSSSRTRS